DGPKSTWTLLSQPTLLPLLSYPGTTWAPPSKFRREPSRKPPHFKLKLKHFTGRFNSPGLKIGTMLFLKAMPNSILMRSTLLTPLVHGPFKRPFLIFVI
ncbi:hypothetical protein SO802_001150, partial [Lithocarpus litseifolius]